MVVAPIYRRISIAVMCRRISIAPVNPNAALMVATVIALLVVSTRRVCPAVAAMASVARSVSGHRRTRAHGQHCNNCQGDC